MKISLLIIATEILEGKIRDQNGQFLSSFLKQHHLELKSTLVVRDHLDEITYSIEKLFSENDVLIISGGLGPTKDDLTKIALAEYLKEEIVFSSHSHQVAEENYSRFNRPYPGKDHPYSSLPKSCKALSNSTGFAPGIFFEDSQKIIICAPGVPREFESMMSEHFLSWLKKQNTPMIFMENLVFRTKKIPEEKIFNEVAPTLWDDLAQFGEVSSLPVLMGVDIGVKIKAHSEEELSQKKMSIKNIFSHSPISNAIWSEDYSSIEEKIVGLANEKNITFSFAESCTGGLCSHRITNVSGSSQTFLGSVVSYHENVKTSLLHVSKETIQKFGVVSLETAEEMARGVAKALNTKLALSLTGLAGPSGGTHETPVGTVCIGIYENGKISSRHLQFQGKR